MKEAAQTNVTRKCKLQASLYGLTNMVLYPFWPFWSSGIIA